MKNKITIKPVPGRVLVEVSEIKSKGGLILPDGADVNEPGKTYPDVVVASGISYLKAGMTVIYVRWGKPEIIIGKKKYKVLKEEEVLAILEE